MNKKKPIAIRSILSFSITLLSFWFINTASLGQVTAGFTVSDSIGCTSFMVQFQNTGSTGADYSYRWQFTSAVKDTSILENPVFTFIEKGSYVVTQTVTNKNTLESLSTTKTITVYLTPPAKLTIDSTNACVNGDILFTTGYSDKDSVLWDFGDGQQSRNAKASYLYYAYGSPGIYNMSYITYYSDLVCSDTSNYTIRIDGPEADFTINPELACKGEPIVFTMTPISDVLDFSWEFDDGWTSNDNPATHALDTMGEEIHVRLYLTGTTESCMIQDTFKIHILKADFSYSETLCDQVPVVFFNNSQGHDVNYWDFGEGDPETSENPSHTFNIGTHTVKLIVQNIENCIDSIEKNITIEALPEINLGNDITICPGEGGTLVVEGGDVARWRPSYGLDDPSSYQPLASPDTDTTYTVTITDTLTHCSNSGDISVFLQEGFITGKILVSPTDTSIIVGDPVPLTVVDSLANERIISYSWSPDIQISCTDCANPVVQPLTTTLYILEVSDDNQCFISETFEFSIEVTEEYRIGLPEAFTPNGDEINETIQVAGWGIKELIEFRIYNRGGKEVFFTNDINEAWDGSYEGKPQMSGSYQYYLKAEMWDGNIQTQNGTFTLLR